MRGVALLVTLGALASCTTAPEQATRTPQGQQEYERLVAGKVPGAPVQCLPSYNMNDMVVIDESTVAYRLGGNRVYVNHLQGACNGLGRNAIMVTKSLAGSESCRGDIVTMVDQSSHMLTGSCAFGDFIPYTRPR
jgi:hypothetical protein